MPNTMTTATATGLRPSEYNALIHAMWRIDQLTKELATDDPHHEKLRRDRQALLDLFNRLT
jgi:hypothetical protein